ncbi:ATP-binding cassette domain-containing protein [Alteriqipengyuania sp.]|uniref:ATP-binding cassette domain-containing protein n=1 Tax=Alteriqipengyuania sp. TaxID=2800692 RepID=UPI0035199CF4
MLLTVSNVGKAYGGVRVLGGATFELAPQERVLLLGPSGSGKSTLINIVCGLQSPDEGTVLVDGVPIAAADGSAAGDEVRRKNLGIVFQTLRLISALSLRSNLALAQRLQTGSSDEGMIGETLERLGITHRADARPSELSQGEAQRAAIARAIVVKPKLLIADEPTSALDHVNAEAVAKLLLELSEQAGTALLVATHDDRLAPYFSRTLRLESGKLADSPTAQGVPA